MHNFKKPSDGKWWWQCFQDFSESQTNTKCIKTAQICGDAYAMKGTFRVTGRQLHLESEGSGILIATICNPRHGSNMPMKWRFRCQMGTTENFFFVCVQLNKLCMSSWDFFFLRATQPAISFFNFKQPMLDIAVLWDKDNLVAKMSAQTESVQTCYFMTKSYKVTPEPWYLNSFAIFKSTHQLMVN